MSLNPASSHGQTSEEDVYRKALGVVSFGVPLLQSFVANALPTSQTIYAVGCPYRSGQVVTNIGWVVSVAASGTAPTGIFCGLCSTTTMLMDSANLAASAAWTTVGPRTVALSSALTIPSDGIYYHLFLQNGAFSVTQPQFNRLGNPGGQINAAGVFMYATAGTGQTTLPAVNAAVTLASTGTPNAMVTFST